MSSGRRSLRFWRASAFVLGSLGGATLTYLAVYAVLGRLAEHLSWLVSLVLACLGGWAVAWWAGSGRSRVSLRQRQVRRSAVSRGVPGAAWFGWQLGLGWWTIVPSPVF